MIAESSVLFLRAPVYGGWEWSDRHGEWWPLERDERLALTHTFPTKTHIVLLPFPHAGVAVPAPGVYSIAEWLEALGSSSED